MARRRSQRAFCLMTDLAAVIVASAKAKKSAPVQEKSLLGKATGYAK